MTTLSAKQVETLLRPINPNRVSVLDGLSHLEAFDVRAHLIRIFGFGGWSGDVLEMTLLYEQETFTRQNKPAYKVAYRCTYRLTIHATGATYTEVAVGESVMPDFKRGDCHDMAAKTAESQALKRTAVNLGSQYGLSLYSKGSREEIVKGTLIGGSDEDVLTDIAPVVPELDDKVVDITEPVPDTPSGEQETAPAPSESNGSRAPEEASAQLAEQVGRVRDQVLDLLKVPTKPKDALGALTRISLDASRAKLMDQPTLTPKGEPTTVRVLIDEAIKYVSREQVKS